MRHLWKDDADLMLEPDVNGFSFDCFDRQTSSSPTVKWLHAPRCGIGRLLRLPEPQVLSKRGAQSTSTICPSLACRSKTEAHELIINFAAGAEGSLSQQ